MAAKIFEFKKPEGDKPHHRSSDAALQPMSVRAKTNHEIFCECFDDVIGEWQASAAKNQLSNYIASKLPVACVAPLGTDYVNDLNVISNIEQKLEMRASVFYPTTTHANQHGWMATFHLGKEIFSTPADMASEANARALLIVLYLRFQAVMKSLGRNVT